MGSPASLLVLLVCASVVAMTVRRLRLPYTVALVLAGLALGYARELVPAFADGGIRLTEDVLLPVFLPALLFEASFHLDIREFRRNLRAILLLAVPGIVISIGITGLLVFELEPLMDSPLPLLGAFLLASILSATDPVSVIALFKELGAPKRLSVLMEGESLLNDGTAVVAFVAIAAMMGLHHTDAPVTIAWVGRFLLWEIFVGVAVGAAVGLAASWVTSLIEDHLVEVTLTTIAAFGSYLVADALHASGVLAVVAAGMACGNVGAKHGMGPTTKIAVVSFWEYLAFLANSLVFLLLGQEIDLGRLAGHAGAILIAWVVLTLARASVVFSVSGLLSRTTERIPSRWRAVLVWGGLRGGLSMVLALSLPTSFPQRELLVDMTFGVVLLSILVQGLSVAPVLRWAGAVTSAEESRQYMRLRGTIRATREALRALDQALASGDIHQLTFDRMRERLAARMVGAEEALDRLAPTAERLQAEEIRATEERLYDVERAAIRHAKEAGILSDEIARELLSEVDGREVAAESVPLHSARESTLAPEPSLAIDAVPTPPAETPPDAPPAA